MNHRDVKHLLAVLGNFNRVTSKSQFSAFHRVGLGGSSTVDSEASESGLVVAKLPLASFILQVQVLRVFFHFFKTLCVPVGLADSLRKLFSTFNLT